MRPRAILESGPGPGCQSPLFPGQVPGSQGCRLGQIEPNPQSDGPGPTAGVVVPHRVNPKLSRQVGTGGRKGAWGPGPILPDLPRQPQCHY